MKYFLSRRLFCSPLLGLCTALSFVFLPVSAPRAQVGIKAVVNNQVITSVEVEQRAKILTLTGEYRGANVKKKALEDLISDSIRLQEGARWRVRVSEADINRAIAGIAQNARLSTEQLNQILSKNGINPKSLRQRLRAELTWQQLVAAKVRTDISRGRINTASGTGNSGKDGDEKTPPKGVSEYDLAEVVFVVPRKNQNSRGKQQSLAKSFVGNFKGCDQSLEPAKKLTGVIVRRVGARSADTLTPFIANALEKVPVGKTTQIFPTAQGFTVYAVCSKRDIDRRLSSGVPSQGSVTPDEEMAREVAERFEKELRAKAIIEYR